AAGSSCTAGAFHHHGCPRWSISGIRPRFQGLSQSAGQIAHVLLTRSPLIHPEGLHRSTCMC
ncbi:LOW QUALITY PROTEIN: conserved hypothetical protein, partial [Streptomyces viridochromogenes DSM 40736]